MNIIGLAKPSTAVIFYTEQYAKESGLQYTVFEEIPDGTGLLKTDLKTLWWEPIPEPEPEPKPEPTDEERFKIIERENKLLKSQVSVLSNQVEFTEELIAELAMEVYQV